MLSKVYCEYLSLQLVGLLLLHGTFIESIKIYMAQDCLEDLQKRSFFATGCKS